uniref:NADH-ubiquinone oxidoreductase chain 2 n=1 Tax=Bactrothrips quadrituberculatus TaxID=1246465 RepID=A0A8E5JZU4_9NEOP|nr:NADH dehydrogenase subunit 2 [Bactrothrips quadrituberculatus]QVD42814.1 NADH dehydrogenase subunit 2 [Bactrothrips quadrituberculatus]
MFIFQSNYFLILCKYMMILGILFGLNSYSWFSMWMSMEIMLMSFIPCLIMKKSVSESYSTLKYFIFQCLGSSFFILGMMEFFLFEFMILGLFIKLGFFPNHFWVISISKHMNWFNFFLLMTIQKILPLWFLVNFFYKKMFFFFILILLNSIVGNLGSLNQMDLRVLLVFSSMNHMTWMLFTSLMNMLYFYFYLISYILMMMLLCFFFFNNNIFYLYQLFYLADLMLKYKVSFLSLIFLSFLGFPPLLGFFLKFVSIMSFNYIFLSIWIFIMLMMNLFLSFSYLRVFLFLYMKFFRSVLYFNSLSFNFFSLIFLFIVLVF